MRQHHILRPLFERNEDTRAVSMGVIAECDSPNDKRRVNDLHANFVEDFGDANFHNSNRGPSSYRNVSTGESVEPRHVCKHCIKARARRAAGARR